MVNGRKGVIVFKCIERIRTEVSPSSSPSSPSPSSSETDVSSEQLYLHVDLFGGILEVFRERDSKKVSLNEVFDIRRCAADELQLQIQVFQPTALCYRFSNSQDCEAFQRYLEYWHDSGDVLKRTFEIISNDQDVVDKERLVEVLYSQGLVVCPTTIESTAPSAEDLAEQMISHITAESAVDFFSYFHLFFDTPMHSLFSCLSEWKYLSKHCNAKTTSSNDDCNQNKSTTTSMFSPSLSSSLLESEVECNLLPGETLVTLVNSAKWYIGGRADAVLTASRHLAADNPKGHQAITSLFPSVGLFSLPFLNGSVVITNYRLILVSKRKGCRWESRYGFPSYFNRIHVPLNSISSVGVVDGSRYLYNASRRYSAVLYLNIFLMLVVLVTSLHSQATMHHYIQLETKDLCPLVLKFLRVQLPEIHDIVDTLKRMCFSGFLSCQSELNNCYEFNSIR